MLNWMCVLMTCLSKCTIFFLFSENIKPVNVWWYWVTCLLFGIFSTHYVGHVLSFFSLVKRSFLPPYMLPSFTPFFIPFFWICLGCLFDCFSQDRLRLCYISESSCLHLCILIAVPVTLIHHLLISYPNTEITGTPWNPTLRSESKIYRSWRLSSAI